MYVDALYGRYILPVGISHCDNVCMYMKIIASACINYHTFPTLFIPIRCVVAAR